MNWALAILIAIRALLPLAGPSGSSCAGAPVSPYAESACPCCEPGNCPCAMPDDPGTGPSSPAWPGSAPRTDISTLIHFPSPAPTPMPIGWDLEHAGLTPNAKAETRLHPALNARVQAALCIWRT